MRRLLPRFVLAAASVALGKGNSVVEGWVQISGRAGSKPAFVLDWNYLFQ